MPRDLEAAPVIEYLTELDTHNERFWGNQHTIDDLLIHMVFDEHAIQAPDTANKKRRRRIEPERFSTDEARRQVELIVSLYPHIATVGVKFTGDGTVDPPDASYNITSVTDNATGSYTVTWATDFSGVDYAMATGAGSSTPSSLVGIDSDLIAAGSVGL
ncbi:hypothetical protein LCGC14_2262740 [marine sediment metagenome]|uniref:Uncharacterized protein n=1 Tax=marine sediment metagenome TaxID=412755 RepID=A0A0F9DLJ6_9ZZZZ